MNQLFAGEMTLKWIVIAVMFLSLFGVIRKLPRKLKIVFFSILGGGMAFILLMVIFFPETLIHYNNQILEYRKEKGLYWMDK